MAGEKRDRRKGLATRLANLISRAFVLVLILAAAAMLGGYLQFSSQVSSLENPGTIDAADGIVVLTGGNVDPALYAEVLTAAP